MGENDDTAHRDDTSDVEKPEERRRSFDRAIPDLLKRAVEKAVETGVGRLSEGPDGIRNFMGDMKVPKEVLHYLYQQVDDTKAGLYRVVAKEIRDVIEHTQFADEITKVLTKLSFEIKTEIRFVPNDARSSDKANDDDGDGEKSSDQGDGTTATTSQGLPKPTVSSQVTIKDRTKDVRHERKRREGT